ncbi:MULTISPECIES: hypothetical protein [Actinotignum]|uniref:hypothetical protein n=1 Tax=Actinotignum TaxID=1653174 RepID=UPI00254A00F6|nr:hypothetical protein [Actinotignum schaalii]MDK7271571.1 hypothetical protein [Actinotignum schaalii]
MSIATGTMRKKIASVALGALAAAGALSLTVGDAQALGGNCSAWLQSDVGATWAEGSCSSLNSDTKARVTLDLASFPDFHSAWFTKLNKTYRTGAWSASMRMGWPRDARIDYGRR